MKTFLNIFMYQILDATIQTAATGFRCIQIPISRNIFQKPCAGHQKMAQRADFGDLCTFRVEHEHVVEYGHVVVHVSLDIQYKQYKYINMKSKYVYIYIYVLAFFIQM